MFRTSHKEKTRCPSAIHYSLFSMVSEEGPAVSPNFSNTKGGFELLKRGKCETGVLYMDFAKALNKVDHKLLLRN